MIKEKVVSTWAKKKKMGKSHVNSEVIKIPNTSVNDTGQQKQASGPQVITKSAFLGGWGQGLVI